MEGQQQREGVGYSGHKRAGGNDEERESEVGSAAARTGAHVGDVPELKEIGEEILKESIGEGIDIQWPEGSPNQRIRDLWILESGAVEPGDITYSYGSRYAGHTVAATTTERRKRYT